MKEEDIDNTTYVMLSFLLNYDVLHLFENDLTKLLNQIYETKHLPTDLLMTKFFEYAQFLNLPNDKLYEILNIGTDLQAIEAANLFINFIKEKKTKFIKFDEKTRDDCYKLICYLINYIKIKNVHHQGLPVPDPCLGRPRLSWCRCQYLNCGKIFTCASDLVRHLVNNNVYAQGYHQDHERALKGWTVDNVISKSLIRCPSIVCSVNTENINNPHDLIKHFTELGISPFWQPSSIEQDEKSYIGIELIKKVPKLYLENVCPICLENNAQVIINSCGHHVYCITCMKNCDKYRCPICRCKVDCFWPYA